jgi:hypothetical protein
LTVPAFLASSTEPTAYNYLMIGTGRSGRLYSYSSGALYFTTRTYTAYLNQAVGSSFSIGSGFSNFTGEIYEILVFTNSLYDLDNTGGLITQVYNNQASMYESFVGGTGPGGNATLSLPGTSGNVMNLGTFFPSRADPSTSNIFVEAWVYLPTGATGFPFTVSDSGSEDMGLLVNYSSTVQFRVWDTLGNGVNSTNNGALASATWYHVAGSWDKTNNRVYGFVNGVVGTGVGVFSGTARARSSSNMTIGAGNSGTFFPFNGYIRDFRMVKGGIVPTTTFTPVASAPFGPGTPTYVASMGTPVLSLYTQYFTPSWLALPGTQGSYMNLGVPSGPYFAPTFSTFIQCWIYINSTGANAGYIVQATGIVEVDYTDDWALRVLSGGTVQLYVQNASIVTGAVSSSSPLSAGRWYHIAVSYAHNVGANGTLYMFVNGTLQNSSAMSAGGPRFSPTNIITVGSRLTTLGWSPLNSYTQDLQVVRGGSVPTTTFTPTAAPFGLVSPSYAPGGSVVLSLATQYMQKVSQTGLAPLISVSPIDTYPVYSTTSAPTFTSSAVVFTGSTNVSGNFLNFGPQTFDMTKGFSAVARVNIRSLANWQRIFDFGNGTPSDNILLAQYSSNNTLRFSVAVGATEYGIQSYFPTFTTGTYFTVVAIFNPNDPNGQRSSIYVDGVLQGFNVFPAGTITGTRTLTNCYVGRSNWSADNYMNMDLNFLKMYNRVLSDAEIGYLGASPKIYLSPTSTYPGYSTTSAPTFTSTAVSFTGSTNVSGNFLNFGPQTFDMSLGVSIVALVNFRTNSSWQRLIDFGNGAPSNNILIAQNSTSATLRFSIATGVTEYALDATNAITFGTYQQITCIYDYAGFNKAYIYINGNLLASFIPSSSMSDTRTLTNCYVGRSNWASDYYANMDLQYLNVYNRCLTASEIANPPSGAVISVTSPPRVSQSTRLTMSGQPLFSQLSTAATSSAVGAYSLRSVNGATVKVAKVNAKYPTGTFSTYTSIYGVVSASSEYPPGGDNPYAWKAFDGLSTSPNYWASGPNYTQGIARTTGTVTVAGGTNYYGDWLQIQLPVSFVPTGYALVAQQAIVNTPGTWYVFGSTDGSTWTLLDTRSGIASSTFTNFVYNTYTITGATTSYNYYRIVCNIVSVNTSFALAEFNVLRSADFWADRRGNLLSAPVTGQPLGDWLQGVTGLVETWYDQSPAGNHATQANLGIQPIIQRATKGPGFMLVFNNAQYLIGFTFSVLNNTNYTVCKVDRRTASISSGGNGVDNAVLSCGNTLNTNQNMHITYRSGTSVYYGQYNNDISATITNFATAATEPIRYNLNMASSTSGRRLYVYNDPLGPILTSDPARTALLAAVGGNFYIGYYSNNPTYYTGELYEVLVFRSSLYDLDNTGGQVTAIYQNQLSYTGT